MHGLKVNSHCTFECRFLELSSYLKSNVTDAVFLRKGTNLVTKPQYKVFHYPKAILHAIEMSSDNYIFKEIQIRLIYSNTEFPYWF